MPASPIRIPAEGVASLGLTPTEQLSEVPPIPGLETRDDGSLILRDGRIEWGLWRVADGLELARGGRAYVFKKVGGDEQPGDYYAYCEHPNGSTAFTRRLSRQSVLHCTFAPAKVTRDGEETWYVNGRVSRKDGPAIERPNGSFEWRLDGKLHREGDEPALDDGRVKQWSVKGKRHRLGGPAVIIEGVGSEWWVEGELHREDGPAVERADGSFDWYRHGIRHREDGPASRREDGALEWAIEGLRHREDGPAVVQPDGIEIWYRKGQIHNEAGPALVRPDGSVEYILEDIKISRREWQQRTGRLVPRTSAAGRAPSSVASAMNRR